MTEARRLLTRFSQGEHAAAEQLLPLVYGELYLLACRSMRGQRTDHTLQPTALVHEAFLRLVGGGQPWQSRTHFLAVAAKAMRSVLVDHARARLADKRGGGKRALAVDDVADRERDPTDVMALHEALDRLGAVDPFLARLVELRFFGGLTVEEAAEVLGASPRTVKRGWRTARAWLARSLGEGDRGGP